MRVLFCTGSPASYMAPPPLGDEQIVAGPDWPDEERDGRRVSLTTPLGGYDLATVLDRLSSAQAPDVVVCLVDASWRNMPQHLSVFRGPKVLLIADTHHMGTPISGMLRYARSEPFDRIVFLYDRHHLSIFRAAGLDRLFWFPGLTFPHDDAFVRAKAARAKRGSHIAFVGQAASYHPRRARLLAALQSQRLPLVQKQLPQRESLAFYGDALIGFNASLNGDLNLRAFEILASGAMLLTDRLVPAAGLASLWGEGREVVTYGDATELVERARHYLAQPREARAVGEAGARWFATNFNADRRRAAFSRLVFDGQSLPEFEVPAESPLRVHFPSDTPGREAALEVYENVQELHRTQETVRVSLDTTVPEDFAQLCRTLPRVQVTREAEPAADAAPDWRVVDYVQALQPGSLVAPRVWCWNGGAERSGPLWERFADVGFIPLKGSFSLFVRVDATLPPNNKGAQAYALMQRGDLAAAFVLARAAFAEQPRSVDALVVLGAVALNANNRQLGTKLVQLGLQLDPHDARLLALAAQLRAPRPATTAGGATEAPAPSVPGK